MQKKDQKKKGERAKTLTARDAPKEMQKQK